MCGRLAMWDSPQCALGEFSSHCARPPSVRSRRRNPCFVLSAVQALLRRPARSRGYTSTALRWEIDAWAIEAPNLLRVTAFKMVACVASSPLAHRSLPSVECIWSCAHRPRPPARRTCPCGRRAGPPRSSAPESGVSKSTAGVTSARRARARGDRTCAGASFY